MLHTPACGFVGITVIPLLLSAYYLLLHCGPWNAYTTSGQLKLSV